MRTITVGAAQLGPIARAESRSDVVKRLLAHLHEAKARGCELVVFPELALTTFFPRWYMEDQGEIDRFFERELPGPETYRVMGLQGVEMILLGYNTPMHHPPAPEQDALTNFHNSLVMQAGAYQNATWVVGVAKCGREEGCDMIGQSQIIAPSGETVAMASTLGDELVVARCDLDQSASYKRTVFNFARHRRPEHYGLIVERTGAVPPA
jgi:predicted amidohydrolase